MDKKLKAEIEALGKRTKARTAKRQLKEGRTYVGSALETQGNAVGKAQANAAARAAFIKAKAEAPLMLVYEFTLNVRQELLGKTLECLAAQVHQQLTTELVLWAGSSGEQHDFHLLTFTLISKEAAVALQAYLAEHGWKLGVRFEMSEVRS